MSYPPRMRGQFTGWPEQAMDVLWQLQGEPTHATRERYRAEGTEERPDGVDVVLRDGSTISFY